MRRKSKTIVTWSLIAIGVLGLASIGHFYMWRKFALTVPHSTIDATPVHVVLSTREYWIPRNYFILPYTERSKSEKTLFIRAYYPKMNGATEGTIEHEKKNFGHGRKIKVLVSAETTTFQDGIYRIFDSYVNNENYNFSPKTSEYSLYYFQNTFEKPSASKDDIYVDDLNNPTTIIFCTGKLLSDPLIKSPSCKQHFYHNGESYRVSYSRDYLPQWYEIREAVNNLFDNFSIKPANISNMGE